MRNKSPKERKKKLHNDMNIPKHAALDISPNKRL